MTIYINTNGDLIEETKELIQHLKRERGINSCVDWKGTLSEVEEDCCVCVINLAIFKDSNVNLRSGCEIGLSNWFKILTIAIVDPANEDLKNDLEKIDVHALAKEEIDYVLNYISDEIVKTEKLLKTLKDNIYMRRDIRKVVCEEFETKIDKALTVEERLNTLKRKY